MRDDELISRKVEHLSTINDLLRSEYCITKRVLANSICICWEHTLRDRFFKQRSEERTSFSRANQIFQAQAIAACLIERGAETNQFSSSCQERA